MRSVYCRFLKRMMQRKNNTGYAARNPKIKEFVDVKL